MDKFTKITSPDSRIDVPLENLDKFKEAILYIVNKVGKKLNIGATVICKLLYFIDFDYYEKYEKQLIGAVYIKNHYGPTPKIFLKVIEEMVNNGDLKQEQTEYHGYDQIKYVPCREATLSLLTDLDIKHIDDVLEKLSDKNGRDLSELSHKDVPYIAAKEGEPLAYESVFYRTAETSARNYK